MHAGLVDALPARPSTGSALAGPPASIRTPDQRVRVFVSSTLQELADERRAARDAIESLRMTPVMFEQGARPHPPRALYRAYLDQSDVFIGLYWERYGWIAPGEKISGLEDEYVLSGARPTLIYVKAPAPNREPRLSTLVERIELDDRASYRHFSDADELRSLIANDLAVLLTERFVASGAPGTGERRSQALVQLPRAPTRLVGREEDVERVLDLLADRETRLVTIFGPGGIGKSRLALAVAERATERHGDVVYLELAPVSEPSLLLPTIARALGMQERTEQSVEIELQERLADARMLIVLDNIEQLADAAGSQIADLLLNTRQLQLLVTSRRVLEIRGERVFAIEPLAVPLAEGATSSAVELFLEHARAIRPGYQPSDDELAAFGELSRRLDGLPLAIELASARLRTLSPRAVLDRMGHRRLEFLNAGPRDLPTRQRTLRDTIAWSHSLLPDDAQLLFARLAVFVGSADLEAIERVANPDGGLDMLDQLATLVDESLVRTAGEASQPRFAMLETIREFAVEQLEAHGDATDYRARHEAYYVELAERGDAALGTADQVDWLDRFGRETDNFRAVLRRAVRRDDAASALRMGRALATSWHMRGSYSEGRGWTEQIGALPSADPRERAVAWTIGAIQAFLQGDFALLEEGLDEALSLIDHDEEQRFVEFARMLQAIARGTDADRTQVLLTERARSLEARGERLAAGFGLLASAYVAMIHGRIADAGQLAQAALDLSIRIGEWYVRAYASVQLARVTLESGDWKEAQRHAIESIVAARRLHNIHVASYGLELWADAMLAGGLIDEAGRLFALAERGYQQTGSGPWRTDAELHAHRADLRAALGERYERASAEARESDLDEAIAELIAVHRPGA